MKRIEALVLAMAVAISAPLSVSGAIICSGESASVTIDSRTGVRESNGNETLAYSSLWDGGRPSPELPLLCRERDVVDSREVPQRYPCTSADVVVPCRAQHLALDARHSGEKKTVVTVCGIIVPLQIETKGMLKR